MMWSVSVSYRLGLGFHALNNEGSDGSNLMQPRRIDVGRASYDGISGEMVRRHVLEGFVRICEREKIPLLTASRALHPDRGPLGMREVAKSDLQTEKLTKANVFAAARSAVKECALIDIGGFLAAFSQKAGSGGIPESGLVENIAEVATGPDLPLTVKRDSVFDVGWLVSEAPQEIAITQHAAYRPTGEQSLFSQTMRSNVYGGVIRADLYRIGTDDYWYLQKPQNGNSVERLVLTEANRLKRQKALVEAIINYIAAPTGAKVAGWAPHVFKTEGVILLTSSRTAPFASPIRVNLEDPDGRPIQPDHSYTARALALQNDHDTWVWEFKDVKGLFDIGAALSGKLAGTGAE